ncbi:MAG: tRNA threonylcarbamoyladenosine dehydratase [Syntrophomonadaceae bacterium]|nr:tRNA threonylcarbamoyladenosine dehydratase [Syntrophomonadaceae bacterium]
MVHEFSRTEMLIGKEALQKLAASRVAVFGIGGVGSFAVEALIRSGVGKLVLVDDDNICVTNINRQIHASHRTVGKAKVEVMRERILDINPHSEVEVYQEFYMPGRAEELLRTDYDYVIDAVDTVTAKIDLVVNCQQRGIPIISCMGTGNKLDPSRFEISDIYATSVCPLAKVMRKELRKRGVDALKVVYSKEEPLTPMVDNIIECNNIATQSEVSVRMESGRQIPGSIAFVPSAAGLLLAAEVVKDLIK